MRIVVGEYPIEVARDRISGYLKLPGYFVLMKSSMGQPKDLVNCRGVESDHVSKPLVKFRRRIDV